MTRLRPCVLDSRRKNQGDEDVPQLTITFGLHLEGQRATTPANRLGDLTVGPMGFLNILETQLGLLAEYPSPAERIVQYRDGLSQADAPARFYHRTFATDPLGTAATLLGWRDTWYLHGWEGLSPSSGASRISDLADVEGIVRKTMSPSVGERLAAVLNAMSHRQPAISEIRLVDPVGAFPQRWQAVLNRLPVKDASAPAAFGVGFLGSLQKNLANATSSRPYDQAAWLNDGSVLVVQAESRFLSSAWLAAQLNDDLSTLMVATADATRIDAALVSASHPRMGMRETSAFRPTLQVLPLALEILWDPLNFHAMVQFLTHPVCPVPGFARRKLAEKVADAPGIGGQRWHQVLAEIDKHYGFDIAPTVREKIARWVEHARHSPEVGVPVGVVLDRVNHLVNFFRFRLGDEDAARRLAYQAGFSQCRACLEALRNLAVQGVTTLRPRQLQQLVGQATASGTDNPLWVAEVGAQRAITHPAAAIEPADQVIWWQLAMPVLPAPYPWSAAEIQALASLGVSFPTMEYRLAQVAQEWLRPILAARKKLVLVLPPKGEEVHPLWQMIEAVIADPVIQALEQFLSMPSAGTSVVSHQPLPAPKRWWQLPEGVVVPLRDKESFSSLELLLFNPYHWLLKYPAKLRPSGMVSMGGDFRMLGNLAHGLVERFFQHPNALRMTGPEFDSWFADGFMRLVSEEGAVLLMAGQGSELEGFRYRLHQSMTALRQQIEKAGIEAVSPEKELKGQFIGGELSGYADLVMQTGTEEAAIVDMKWSGAKKYPEKFRHNRHLQLAIYAELHRQTQGAWPAVAYYILDKARFFAPDRSCFPDVEAVPSISGENTAQLWLRFVDTWKWRTGQIAAGAIEVALDSIPTTDESVPPDSALAMENLNEAYNDYRALAGWESCK